MNGFNKVSYKVRTFKRDFTKEREAVLLNAVKYCETTIPVLGYMPVKVYRVNGFVYVYCDDKSVIKITSRSSFQSTGFTSEVPPLIISVIRNGARKVLFVGTNSAEIDGQSVDVPFGESYAEFCGRLFIAAGRKIYYSAEFDRTNFSEGLDFGGFIETDVQAGNIVCLAVASGKLAVLCEHALYELSPFGESFGWTLSRITDKRFNATTGSACGTENGMCFISDGVLYLLSDGKITAVGKELNEYAVTETAKAEFYDGLFVLPFVSGEKSFIYLYDVASGKTAVKECGACVPAGAYGYLYGSNVLLVLKKQDGEITVSGADGEYDFGTCLKKAVLGVEAHINGYATINIEGEGVFRATINDRCNAVSCFVHGRSFKIAFTDVSEDFKIYGLTVKYTVYGG